LTPRVAKIGFPNSLVSFFFFKALGPIQGHEVQHLLVTWGRLKRFFNISALTATVKPLGLISTFAPIGMLDLSSTLSFDSLCKVGLSAKELLFPTHPKDHTKAQVR
jgi:hypothetical protein